jgi:hypothetical protein
MYHDNSEYISASVFTVEEQTLPQATVEFRCQITTYGISEGESGTGAGLFRVLRFPVLVLVLVLPAALYPLIIQSLTL